MVKIYFLFTKKYREGIFSFVLLSYRSPFVFFGILGVVFELVF